MDDDLKSLLSALRAAKEHDTLVEPGFILEALEGHQASLETLVKRWAAESEEPGSGPWEEGFTAARGDCAIALEELLQPRSTAPKPEEP